MDISVVTERVKQFLVEEFEIETDKIKPEATLKSDLGIDSLDFVDIVVIVDDIFGFQINSDDIQKLDTFGELCNYIQERTLK